MSVPVRPRLRHALAAGAAIAALLLPSVLAGSSQAASAPPRLSSAAAARLAAAEATSLPHTAAARVAERAEALARPAKGTAEGSDDLQALLSKVTSSTGVPLYLSISATGITGYPKLDDFGVELETRTGGEAHGWDFPVTTGSFTTTGSGAGTLRSGTDEGAFGSLSLTMAPAGKAKKTEACNASNYTLEQPEKITGTLDFETHSTGAHPWGDVTARSFSFAGADLFTPYTGSPSCTPSDAPTKCYSDVDWYTGSSITAGVGGGTEPDEITADRVVKVAPKGSDRVDVVTAKAPAPKLTTSGSGASMSVTTSGHGATGSGALKSSGAGTTTTFTCIGGTEHDTTWPATFTSSSIKVTGQLYAPMTVAPKTTAGIERITG